MSEQRVSLNTPLGRIVIKGNVKCQTGVGSLKYRILSTRVEIKNAVIGKGSKVSHLAYVGDADIGEGCNIGCGAIFVNYNGREKNRTTVGDNCFIGSNCNVIAPLVIESNSYVCAGTTLTENVKSDDFVIGRVRQQVKENRAHEYLKIFKE